MTTPTPTINWIDPPLLAKHGTSRGTQLWVWTRILLLGMLDALLIAPLIQVVLNEPVTVAYVIAIFIAFAAAISMHIAGRHHAGTRGAGSTRPNPLVIAIITTWSLMGLTFAVLRVIGLGISTDVTGDSSTPAGATPADYVAAGAFLTVYVIAGLLAYTEGASRNDAHTAWLLTRTRLQHATADLNHWEGILVRLDRERTRRQDDVNRVADLEQHEVQRSRALADEAKAFARYEIARHKMDPSVSGITSPRHPDHPDNPRVTTNDPAQPVPGHTTPDSHGGD